MTTYTVITFAPVQGFIEKSRKLRDLYGASQILSYLSYCLVKAAKDAKLEVISPAIREGELSSDLIQGMPNRILIVGEIERDHAFNLFRNTLRGAWGQLVRACKSWVEKKIAGKYDWNMSWKRWEINAWEIFLGQSQTIEDAMRDLETRKLRRGWTVPNWNGESSSLSGYDGIAHPNMDRRITPKKERDSQNQSNPQDLTQEIKAFYKAIAEKLDPSGTENDRAYINENERLSVPELIKRLVTYSEIRDSIDFYRVIPAKDKKAFELEGFTKLLRKNEETQETYWTGWFMGDGDRIGNYLKSLSDHNQVREFSLCLRDWGHKFKQFDLGRVVYAGGDDFLGVIYGTDETPQRDKQEVVNWLCGLRGQWEELRNTMREKGLRVNDGDEPDVSLSVGFVWAGHSVPQRDVLQHCREAEKLAKNFGRDRVTIRVVFNNGQYVQWTTPWECLEWLKDYRDRDGNQTYRKNAQDEYELVEDKHKRANWSHVYGDLAELKARHAISPKSIKEADSRIALELFKLYFGEKNSSELSRKRSDITNKEEPRALIEWIEGMIQVGWQLCSNG